MNFNHFKGILCGLIATLIWSSFYLVSRFLMGSFGSSFDELSFTFYRTTVAMFALLPLAIYSPKRKVFLSNWKKDILPLTVLAAVGIVAEGYLVFVANKYTTAARASLMANTSPIITVLLAWIFVREPMTSRKFVGMILGFTGIIFTLLSQGRDIFTDGGSGYRGELLAFSSGVCWAIYTVAGAKLSLRYGGMFCTSLLLIISVPIMGLLVYANGSPFSVNWSWQVWCGLIYLGAAGTAVANGLWYTALKHLRPGELGAFGYISAMAAAVLSALMLHERFSLPFLLSITAVLSGVALMVNPGRDVKSRSDVTKTEK